jgi:hypothetical protein
MPATLKTHNRKSSPGQLGTFNMTERNRCATSDWPRDERFFALPRRARVGRQVSLAFGPLEWSHRTRGGLMPARTIFLFAVMLLIAADKSDAAGDDLAWVEDIVLRPNFVLKEGETGTRRWAETPKLTVVGGTRDQQRVVAEVVQHLNETLKRTPLKRIELLDPNHPATTLPVFFVPKQAIARKAAQLGQPKKVVQLISKEKWNCTCWIQTDSTRKGEIQSGVVLVSSDKADARQLRNNLLTTLCYDLGLMSFSAQRPTSVFYRDGDKRNRAEKLTAKDQQLLIWYYNYVPAGTVSVKQLYEDHWRKAMR